MSTTFKIILSGCAAVLTGALVLDLTSASRTGFALVMLGAMAICFGPALGDEA